ncbi:oligosaccharide flippase family protein [Patescibacteria group bacterium]|nr:oligosaccharide flippase family protein [Patescibacteria group bacterium]
MLDKIKDIKSRKEVMDTILVGGASLVGSVFSYLLQFVLGRKLSVEDYGTFNTLLSLASLVGVFAGVFGTSLIKIMSEIHARKEQRKLESLLLKSINFSLTIGGVFFIIILFLRSYISSYINIGDSFLIILFGSSVALAFLMTIPIAYLQGTQQFMKFSILNIVNMFNRFILATVFVFMGLGLRGVYGAAPLSSIISFCIGFFMLGLVLKDRVEVDVSKEFKKIFSFGASVILVNFSMMALNNIDLIIVKRYFSPVEAGYYAGTMTLGKILLFGAGAVSIVMFPKITALYANGEYFMGRLKKLLLLLLAVLLTGVFCYQVFPGIITNLFFGKAFENSVKYLPLFSVFVAFYVLINFLVLFFLAVDRNKVGFLLLPGVVVQYILLNIFHETLWDVIKINILVSIFTLLLLSIYFYFTVPNRLRRKDLKNFKEATGMLKMLD